jgi:ribosome-binding protein aMBF1 (putative translation factor)
VEIPDKREIKSKEDPMKLRIYLWENKITCLEFAKKINYSAKTIRAIVREEVRPSERLAKIIEDATGGIVKMEDLRKIKKGESNE